MRCSWQVCLGLGAAAAIAGCGSSGNGGGGTTSGTTGTTASTNPCTAAAPPGSAHVSDACWFSVTSRFPGGGQFNASTSKPKATDPVATVVYVGPGQGTDVPAIRVAGPERGYAGLSLAAAAKKFVSGEGGQLKAKSTHTTLGGRPAMAYFGTNYRGDEYGLVITVVSGSAPGAGAYTAQLTAKPAVFRSYVSGFDAVLKSFRFLH